MANSQILAIYTAIQALSITVNPGAPPVAVTPTVFGLTGTPDSVETAHLPCRILEIFDNRLQTVQARHSTISGTVTPNMEVIWTISDLMLWCPEAQGRGVIDVAYTLVEYCGKYIDVVRSHEAIIASASIEDCKPIPGIFEYPTESGNFYFGVWSTLSVKERVQ
jgi:hypothetical protein